MSICGKNLERLVLDYFADIVISIRNRDMKRARILLSFLRESKSFHLGYSDKKSLYKALGEKTVQLILDLLIKAKRLKQIHCRLWRILH